VLVAALDADRVARLGLLLVIAVVVLGVVLACLVRPLVLGVLAAAALFGLGALVWTERTALQDCTQRVREDAVSTPTTAPCEFLGLKVDVKVP
jgi:O-antigen ligase